MRYINLRFTYLLTYLQNRGIGHLMTFGKIAVHPEEPINTLCCWKLNQIYLQKGVQKCRVQINWLTLMY